MGYPRADLHIPSPQSFCLVKIFFSPGLSRCPVIEVFRVKYGTGWVGDEAHQADPELGSAGDRR